MFAQFISFLLSVSVLVLLTSAVYYKDSLSVGDWGILLEMHIVSVHRHAPVTLEHKMYSTMRM